MNRSYSCCIAFCFLFLILIPATADEKTDKLNKARLVFIVGAIQRLELSAGSLDPTEFKTEKDLARIKFASNKKAEEVSKAINAYVTESTQDNYASIVKAIVSANEGKDKKVSKTSIKSTGGEGATIKYQAFYNRKEKEPDIKTCKDLTMLTEEIGIGDYYIWTERKGVATSDKDTSYPLYKEAETVSIEEK